ncbi:3-deoxy-D-manno-octulosonic acid transferase [Horticoccus luteus]|uniref:3-deoxy-D-manno-octulosonic acid transferase n=1 Tax=Horticoccus luteus TaxID=2862869 RepID=A0A8F9TYA0_9BACT|nr:glycosyltransferase N-terminal domain-containing protein [Horticoccus luteus]QYM79968.1 3-deoxy-D-manno-octulosonic acid transferase [Horticoccus luteus]
MLWLYRLLFLPVLLVSAPFYLRRMQKRGGYGEHFGQRFGRVPTLPPRRPGVPRIWLQAVSVGEVLAIAPLVAAWRADGVEVYLTTTTSTGYRVAVERYRGQVLAVGYFPLDGWLFSARAWRQVQPDLAVLTEGERWPEHMAQAQRRGVPVIAINARMSDRSLRRMRRWRWAVQPMMGALTRVLASSAHDAERFRELGVPPERLMTTGNLKLDVTIETLDAVAKAKLRRELGLRGGLVLVGSSTWQGEEEMLLQAWRAARAEGVDCSLLIVPRHAERRAALVAQLEAARVSFHLRSRGAAPAEVDVAVGDTTGELSRLVQLADLVFIGKSLPPNEGGQTPVESAALGKPIVFGPAMSNFRVISAELVAAGAAWQGNDRAAVAGKLVTLLQDEAQRATMARAAIEWHRANVGAMGRTLAVIRDELARGRRN